MQPYRLIKVDRHGDVCCVRLRHRRLEENEINQFGDELTALIVGGCRYLALSLGPEPPDCLYSVFLAKLVAVRNQVRGHDGRLVLCEVSPVAHAVFEACLLHKEFVFLPDFAAARDYFAQPAGASGGAGGAAGAGQPGTSGAESVPPGRPGV